MEIELLFPDIEYTLDVGVTTTFEQISGSLPVERLENIDGILTEDEARAIWDNSN